MSTELAISDATFAHLREKLDTERLTDLVLTIAFYCAVVRILATMQIDVEDEYLPYLKQFPLPPAPGHGGRIAKTSRPKNGCASPPRLPIYAAHGHRDRTIRTAAGHPRPAHSP